MPSKFWDYTVPDTMARNVSSTNRLVPEAIRKLYSLQELPIIGHRLLSLSRSLRIRSFVDRVIGGILISWNCQPEIAKLCMSNSFQKYVGYPILLELILMKYGRRGAAG